ncbi:FtsH protease activity modulator HflK [Thiotrichales bacterium 19S3-7]|nr:FtsH protease activity modulator HflK [Thiotrichales bacterium 19S3-7]MCF6801905.1 FtsH protease activity modulator HflK [Thiotrichales bacterium 19S3-11]
MIKKLWWQNKNRTVQLNQNQDGPPDFEEVIKNLFSRKKPNPQNDKKGSNKGPTHIRPPGGGKGVASMILLVVVVFAVIWGVSGIFIVKEGEQAAVLRFGRYVQTVGPGFHWYPRLIETVYEQSVDQVKTVSLSREMLTSEENIASVAFTVNYRISDLKDYLFNVVNSQQMLNQALDAAVRQVIGQSTLDSIISVDRLQITKEVQTELEYLLKDYKTGIAIVSVNMQKATAPDPVKAAFDDVIKAREDRNRSINKAQSYANKVIPQANGQSARILDTAKAYKEKLILQAQADVAQFNAILPEYVKAPKIIEKQIYLTTMQNVLSNNRLYVVDGSGNNNLFMPDVTSAAQAGSLHALANSLPNQTSSAKPLNTTSTSSTPMNQQMWVRWAEANKSSSNGGNY